MWVILFFLNRWPTPFARCSAIVLLRLWAGASSTFAPVKVIPCAPAGLDVVHQGGAAQKRLGGNAPNVQANPAELVSLDTSDLQAELSSPDGRNIPPWTPAYDKYVEVVF